MLFRMRITFFGLYLYFIAAVAAVPARISEIPGSDNKCPDPVESTVWGDKRNGSPSFYDDSWFNVTLPFSISFYGISYKNLWVNVNGILSPGAEQILYSNSSSSSPNHIPVNPNNGEPETPRPANEWVPEKALFVLWQDFFLESGQLHEVWTTVGGSAPSRTITFSWKVSSYGFIGGHNVQPQFSVVFREGRPNVAVVTYSNVENICNGASAVIGIQSFPVGVEWSYESAALSNGDILAADMDTQAFILL